ncbi:hypothetical protein R3P38DRAFT_1872143 [Favolaschia claudopus]|uniref:Uncharacterized protein n=1 Tax=Favolaschia claudopus TaxID=2862362 RepID=A0AAW0DBW6_9AGAR
MAEAPEDTLRVSRPSIQESVAHASLIVSLDSRRTFTDTSTIWGPGTASGRAILALGEATIRGIDVLVIQRRLTTIRMVGHSLTGAMCDDLLELCRPNLYSARIAKQALRLTLSHICGSREHSLSMFVVSLCKWPQDEARLILLTIVYTSTVVFHPFGSNLERLYDFLVTVIQVKNGWKILVMEALALLDEKFPPLGIHPIHLLRAEMTAGHEESPLSGLQEAYRAGMRSKSWVSLHKCGLQLKSMYLDMREVLKTVPNLSAAQIVDIIYDIATFSGYR